MKKIALIDSKRAWSQLLRGQACEDITSSSDRVSKVHGNDLLIIHTSDGVKKDRDALRKLARQNRPTVILITGGIAKELPDDWQTLATEFGATILDNVLHFEDSTMLPDVERARYSAHLHQFLDGTTSSVPTVRAENLLEKIESAVGIVEPLVSALRFWIDATLSQIPLEGTGGNPSSWEHERWIAIATRDEWKNLLLPGPSGVGWGVVFSGRLCLGDSLGQWLWNGGPAVKTITLILDAFSSLHAAKEWAGVETLRNIEGGAIRLLYEIALCQGDLAKLSSAWGACSLTIEKWNPVQWANLLKSALHEAETLSLHTARAVARAEFTCAELIPNEDERSMLHHNTFRQDVLQRLIAHDVSGQLLPEFEDNCRPSRLTELAKLLMECSPATLGANVKSAFAAWRGDPEKHIEGVSKRLGKLIDVWRTARWLARAGLALRSHEARTLDETVKAIECINAVIGSDKIWQQHIASNQTQRCYQATQLWKGACVILECLRHWHAAPTRLFEFYEEI